MIPRPVWVAARTRLAQPRSHTQKEDPKSLGSHAPLTETNTQEGLGALHVGETRRGSWAQPHLLVQVSVPRAGPFTAPLWDTSLPTHHRGSTAGPGHICVGHPLWLIPGWPARQHYIINLHLCRTPWWRGMGSRPWECWAYCWGEGGWATWPWLHLHRQPPIMASEVWCAVTEVYWSRYKKECFPCNFKVILYFLLCTWNAFL